jgi:exodeoxyribonuclease V gamma subunit
MEQGGVVAAMVSELTEAEPKRVPLSIDLEDRRLEGVLTVSEGFGSIGIRMGKLRESDRFNLWIRHLVLIASDLPGLTQSALFTMRDPPLVLGKHQAPEDAKHTLRRLIELAEHGMREPLAFFPEASYAYAAQTLKKKRSNTKSAAKAARDNWLRTGSFGPPGEGEDAYNRVLWGNVCPFERSPDSPDWPEEPDPLWAESLALELWLPFLNQVAQS